MGRKEERRGGKGGRSEGWEGRKERGGEKKGEEREERREERRGDKKSSTKATDIISHTV